MGHPIIQKTEKEIREEDKKLTLQEKKIFAIFAAQRAAFIMMVIGFLIFVFIWYLKNK